VSLIGQAARIIRKFGNAAKLARALDALGDPAKRRDQSAINRWTYPKAKGGTGGVIPSSALPDVLAAARVQGILVTAADLYGEVPR
jgi:hypothetical protein